MRPSLVVIPSPSLDGDSGIRQAREPALVQAFVPEPPVEAFRVRVLHRLARLDEVQRYAALVRPLIQHPPSELGAIVADDALWQPSGECEMVQYPRDALARKRCINLGINLDHWALASEVVDQSERSEHTTIGQRIAHEVHAPSMLQRSLRPLIMGFITRAAATRFRFLRRTASPSSRYSRRVSL